MKTKTTVVLALALMLAFATAVTAGEGEEITVKGKIACAKCTLKAEDATDCQDVLVVKQKEGDPAYYYLVSNEVMEEFGHTCQGSKMAAVSGTVEEKDSKMWLTPTKMEQVEKKG